MDELNLPTPRDLSAPVELSRRVAFVLSSVESALHLDGRGLPLDLRVEGALVSAMHAPKAVDPNSYAVLYRLHMRTRTDRAAE